MTEPPVLPAPLISVVIPAFNAEAYVARTLNTVLAQTYPHFEVIVVDDGSTDHTPAILHTFSQRDPRIRLLQQANAGVAAARNLGIQAARGALIAPLDADDLWHPQTLEKLLTRLQAAPPDTALAYAWSVDIDAHDALTGQFRAAAIEGDVLATLVCHNFIGNASATLIRKDCLEDMGGYSQELKSQQAQGCEDWDLYLRLAAAHPFVCVPEFLIGYRKDPRSMSGDFSQMARSHGLMLQRLQRHYRALPPYFYRLSSSSFYLYLARQSYLFGNYRGTLAWLWQAITIDPLTPFGRYGLYTLALGSLIHLGRTALPSGQHSYHPADHQATPPHSDSHTPPLFPQSTRDAIPPLRLQFKLLVSNVLHHSLVNFAIAMR